MVCAHHRVRNGSGTSQRHSPGRETAVHGYHGLPVNHCGNFRGQRALLIQNKVPVFLMVQRILGRLRLDAPASQLLVPPIVPPRLIHLFTGLVQNLISVAFVRRVLDVVQIPNGIPVHLQLPSGICPGIPDKKPADSLRLHIRRIPFRLAGRPVPGPFSPGRLSSGCLSSDCPASRSLPPSRLSPARTLPFRLILPRRLLRLRLGGAGSGHSCHGPGFPVRLSRPSLHLRPLHSI